MGNPGVINPAQLGFEDGVMRRTIENGFLPRSHMANAYLAGYARGCAHRAWLDARGMQRVEQRVLRLGAGRWQWQLVVECTVQATGEEGSERDAGIACEDAAVLLPKAIGTR